MRLRGYSTREAVRFLAASQKHAGAFLNAVPKHAPFRLHSWAMRIAVQRRLGLPLLAGATAVGKRSRHDKEHDVYGDVAHADGEEGHATRHFLFLQALAKALKSVWGGLVTAEPANYLVYSDHRPDVTVEGAGANGGLLAGDVKLWDALGCSGVPTLTGAHVGFGNTLAAAEEEVHGLKERGAPSDGAFKPRSGAGWVPPKEGQYTRAEASGVDVRCLLVAVGRDVGSCRACLCEIRAFMCDCERDCAQSMRSKPYKPSPYRGRLRPRALHTPQGVRGKPAEQAQQGRVRRDDVGGAHVALLHGAEAVGGSPPRCGFGDRQLARAGYGDGRARVSARVRRRALGTSASGSHGGFGGGERGPRFLGDGEWVLPLGTSVRVCPVGGRPWPSGHVTVSFKVFSILSNVPSSIICEM